MVSDGTRNPFELVKANDLSDAEIAEYFVDFRSGASLVTRIKPRSSMPMIVFGGKGSGKTHLLRYLSHALILKRDERSEQSDAIERAGYFGLYFRCGGLNSDRFSGKGQGDDAWASLFAYYLELWLAQLVINALQDVRLDEERLNSVCFLEGLSGLLDEYPGGRPDSLRDFAKCLNALQREIDSAVNNAALSGTLNVRIRASRGRLSFGLPRLLAKQLPSWADVLFVYLVDEFESLSEKQQEYVNTLVREREVPCTFKIGVRLYGLKTRSTLSGGEHLREHSEYEPLRLDEELRLRPLSQQLAFATSLVERRLGAARLGSRPSGRQPSLEDWFESSEAITEAIDQSLESFGSPAERPYFRKLTAQLQEVLPLDERAAATRQIVEALSYPSDPLMERTNVFLFYRAWARNSNLLDVAMQIAESARGDATEQRRVLKHFRADIVAQLLRDLRLPQRYAGFRAFVQMSAGLPRALLTILKNVHKWSTFLGEEPFVNGKISLNAQSEAIAESSEWFFNEARAPGPDGARVRASIVRLGELLKEMRFSDKPSECSLCTFSVDLTQSTEEARRTLELSEQWSMLLSVRGGQSDRNTGRVDGKFQLHPMIAPRFDLPTSRRGAVALTRDEVSSLFSVIEGADQSEIFRRRIRLLNAPFRSSAARQRVLQQQLL